MSLKAIAISMLLSVATCASVAQSKSVIIVTPVPTVSSAKTSSPFGEDALQIETVRTYLRLTGAGEIYRQSWLHALELNKDKSPPYWPASFWVDVRKEMMDADLSPMALELYEQNIRDSQLRNANEFLKSHTVSELVSSSYWAELCHLQAEDDKNSQALTLKFTQSLIQRVYANHNAEIHASREKYLRDHPDYKD